MIPAAPTEILDKPGPLTPVQRFTNRQHPYSSQRILSTVPGLGAVNTWASQHHERLDGKGYPFRSHDLSFSSRIVAVADVLTAVTDNRPCRKGRTNAQCLAVLDKLLFDGTLARLARPDPASGAGC